MRALSFVSAAALLAAAALSAAAAASGSLPLPEEAMEIAETVAEAAAVAGREDGGAVTGPAVAASADIGAQPASRLLRSLGQRAVQEFSPPPSTKIRTEDAVSGAAGAPLGNVLYGCPLALLRSLLAGAADTDDAVFALAIERETLALCRERQEIVNGIVALEGELGALQAEARARSTRPVESAVGSAVADTHIVKDSAPVRVVSLPPANEAAEEAPDKDEAPAEPAPPDYAWFSIIGTASDLRAGVSDGERVWFVREGDRLPGEVLITGIGTKPPSVRIGGAEEASLPYRPRSIDGSIPSSGNADLGGHVAGASR